MDDTKEKDEKEDTENKKVNDEIVAQKHLEDTTELVQKINENTISEKVTNIINKEKLKQLLEKEKEQDSLDENDKEKDQKNNT